MNNRILTDRDREKFAGLIEKMHVAVPNMMKRKIPRANVQQAFIVSEIIKRYRDEDDILCVGSYEDTGFEYLLTLGYPIIGISPETNGTYLHDFTDTIDTKFDLIFSTSVMEHVLNDEEFIEDICKLLKENGTAILTIDFKETWKPKDKKPAVDYRLYTTRDYKRLAKIIEKHSCFFIDEIIADVQPDFEYEGCQYSFSTMIFKKLE
jgi:SAM-dependent methyltransferase